MLIRSESAPPLHRIKIRKQIVGTNHHVKSDNLLFSFFLSPSTLDMEVIAVATTVCALCQSIQLWIDQLKQRESLIDQISSSVLQIHNILQPFASTTYTGTGEYQLSQSIRCVGDVLQRTKEHLVVWKYKRTHKIVAFINPGAQVAKLKDDQTEINNQLIILLTSIATVGYFRDREMKIMGEPTTTVSSNTESTASGSTLISLDNMIDTQDAVQFWKDFVGAKVSTLSCQCEPTSSHPVCRSTLLRTIFSPRVSTIGITKPLEGF